MNMTWRWLSESWKAASSVVKKGELFLPGTGAAQGIGMISLREKKKPFHSFTPGYSKTEQALQCLQ